MLKVKVKDPSTAPQLQEVAMSPEQHHHIGKNENTYEDIGEFLRNNADNPEIKVSVRDVFFLLVTDTLT